MTVIRPGKRPVEDFGFAQPKLPTHLMIAQYIRQSTDGQIQNNKSSAVMQDKRLRQYLISLGWREDLILKFDQDQAVSGTKGIEEREGMSLLARMLDKGQIGAIGCYSESRLFRDLTRVYSSTFVQLCHVHKIPVITKNRVYWTGNDQERDALNDALNRAARELQDIKDRLLPAKLRTIEEDISHGGHCLPIGFVLTREEIEEERIRKYYLPYEPHARLIRWLFKRYHQLDGNLGRLLHELQVTNFAFPAFVGVGKPHVALKKAEDGSYPLRTRHGLVGLLSNVAYIGWYVYNGWVISKEAHEAIVPMDDFLYAYNRLSTVTLEGEPNKNKPPLNRRSYRTERKGLLEGVLQSNGSSAYILMDKGVYLTGKRSSYAGDSTEINVPIVLLDRDFSVAIRFLLGELEKRHQEGLRDNLYDRLTAAQEEKTAQAASYAQAIANIDTGIQEWELLKRTAMKQQSEPDVAEAIQQLKKLRADKAALEAREKQAGSEQTTLKKCMGLLDLALHGWNELSFETKRQFIRLMVRVVDIREASPHILKLDISLHEPFAYSLDGYIFRHKGAKNPWTEEELTELRRLYPRADRIDLVKALEHRSWEAIIAQAGLMKLKRLRPRIKNDTGIHDALAYADAKVMQSLGMDTNILPWEQDTQEDPVIAVGSEYIPLQILLTSEEVQYKAGLGPVEEPGPPPEPEEWEWSGQAPPPEPDMEAWPEQEPPPEPEDDDEGASTPRDWPLGYILVKRAITLPNKEFSSTTSQRAVAEFSSGL
jgi:DNA invertase Pin-like site-specific DNA recombinase